MTEDDPVATDDLLTIGAFAARARLSAKALRLYDRLGLLAPAYVDELTGYRYYRSDQVERARLVALLRQLDMPLARVAEIVEAVGTDGALAAERLAAYWAGAEERFASQRALVGYLRERLTGRDPNMDATHGTDGTNSSNGTDGTDGTEGTSAGAGAFGTFVVETVDTAAQVVLTQARHLLVDELPAWIGASLGRLEEGAAACGGTAGAPFVVYHSEVSLESDGPAESCVPVADPEAARRWAAEQGRARGAGVRVEPARRLAYTRITKAQVAYPQIAAAFEAVERWIAARGLEVVGPCREVYFADWDAAGPEDPVCDVAFPVAS
ncbi:MerR family transcriptional regulator [Streptomyces sp. NPDC101112]|uniref:MerR family transcriptional regulator n=1 Tax=Streptomyces sp. NPDC101112 TaxID=3366105 RepID=UPI0037FDDB88